MTTEGSESVEDEERRLRERLKAKQRSRQTTSSDDNNPGMTEKRGKKTGESNGELAGIGGEKKGRSEGSSSERSPRDSKKSFRNTDSRHSPPRWNSRRHHGNHRQAPRDMPRDMHRPHPHAGGGPYYPPHRGHDYYGHDYARYGYRGHGPDAVRHERRGPPPPYRPYDAPPQHGHPRGMPPRGWHDRPPYYETDPYGRARRPRSRSRSRSVSSYSSRSRSYSSKSSRSRSRSLSRSDDDDHRRTRRGPSSERHGRRTESQRGSRGEREKYRSSSSGSSYTGSSASSSGSDESDREDKDKKPEVSSDAFTKDQRTVFVNQLVTRTTEKDIKRYFCRKVGCKINDVILLRDKRTGRHKGCAYVELKHVEDVHKALQVSGQPPDFQRFPILVKASEAEKNYIIPASSATVTAGMMGSQMQPTPLLGPDGKLLESQKVYVGSLDPSITQEHLFALFSQFGQLQRVSVQMDPSSGISKGYAFLSFRDPKEANLAIQTMSNQVLGGRPIKTGWASQTSSTPGVEVITSDEFPEDASARAQKAHVVLAQLAIGAGLTATSAAVNASQPLGGLSNPVMGAFTEGTSSSQSRVPTVAEARASLASVASGLITNAATIPGITPVADSSSDAKVIGGASNPTNHLLVHNMFDKDEETEEGWAEEIRAEFNEECSQYGKISNVTVMANEPGGKIYASFETVDGAKTCASNLAGRWFDKRQLKVEYVTGHQIPH